MTEPSARGSNGGKARKEKLSPERRKEIAREAAQRRWAKPKDTPKVEIIDSSLDSEDQTPPFIPPTIQSIPAPIPTPVHPPAAAEPPKPIQKRRKPMVKEFGKAHSYAEKRLAEALKERAEAMGKVAMLNAEIPSLVQIIRALGMTPNTNGFQDFTASIPNTMTYPTPQHQPPTEQLPNTPNNIDPALYATNTNPVPGLAPAIANAPVEKNKPLGGAIDLGYTPVDEDEGPSLPKMGGGWQ